MRLASESEIERGLREQPQFRRALERVAEAVSSEARRIAREEGAGTAYSRSVSPAVEADGVVARASAADAQTVEEGHPVIRPKRGKVLVFEANKGLARRPSGRPGSPKGGTVFAAFVKAAEPLHVMERAGEAIAARSSGLTFRRGRGRPQ